jgi:predicted dehydrogenase
MTHKNPLSINRRRFIKQTALLGASTFVLPRFSIGQPGGSASSRIGIAIIGCGTIARAWLSQTNHPVVALCDPDESITRQAKADHDHLSNVPTFTDFRVMLDRMGGDIDAVVVATPDHNHFVATMDAMQRGKHVYTEKPLTHNIWESRTLEKAAQRYKVKTIMGNQGHTTNGIREMREWYEAGVLGQVERIDAWFPGPNWNSRWFPPREVSIPLPYQKVPSDLNWDLWLGPVVGQPYHEYFQPRRWRAFWDFGCGMLGDWFPHICDGPIWAMGLYEPTRIEAVKLDGVKEGACPDGSIIRYVFPAKDGRKACSLYWHDGGNRPATPDDWSWGNPDETGAFPAPAHGSFWHGEKGNFYLDNRSNNPRVTSRDKMREMRDAGVFPDPVYPRVSGGPRVEWWNAILGEGPDPGSNFAYAAPFNEVTLLGVLAQRFGGVIEWDARNMRITNRPELNAYLKPPVRKGWEYGEDLWRD